MKPTHPTGLGEPEPTGKLTLFQPPKTVAVKDEKEVRQIKYSPDNPRTIPKQPSVPPGQQRRIRTTIDLTSEALMILQQIQQKYRLTTGKVLPLWKAVSQAIADYGRQNKTL